MGEREGTALAAWLPGLLKCRARGCVAVRVIGKRRCRGLPAKQC